MAKSDAPSNPDVAADPVVSDPAARLMIILRRVLEQPANISFGVLWARSFGVSDDDFVGIYGGLHRLNELTDDVERAIQRVPDIRHEQYIKSLPMLREILARPNLGDSWFQSKSVLRMVSDALEFSSERLQAYSPEPVVPEAELSQIRKQAESLLDLLRKSVEIPRSLKAILFDLVKGLLRSIDEYEFRGIRAVRHELFIVASQIQENLSQFEANRDKVEVKTFFSLFKKIDAVTSAVLKVKELAGAFAPLIGQALPLLENVVR